MNPIYYDEDNKLLGYEYAGFMFEMFKIIYPVIYLISKILILYLIGQFLLENMFISHYKLFRPFEFTIGSILTGLIFCNLCKKYYRSLQQIFLVNQYNADLVKKLLKENEQLKVVNIDMRELLKSIASFAHVE